MIALVFIFFAILFVVAQKSLQKGLLVVVFFSSWMGLDADIGLRISGYRIALLSLIIAFIVTVLAKKMVQRPASSGGNSLLYLFICYAVLSSLYALPSLPTVSLDSGLMRSGILRPLFQIIMFGLAITPLFFIPTILTNLEDIVHCGRVYLVSITILAFLGWVQLILWYGIGYNPFPIGIVNAVLSGAISSQLREGVDWIGNFPIYRMNSFGGEPKGLAQAIAVGLLILQSGVAHLPSLRIRRGRLIGLWLFLILSLVFTWSTSGIFLWLIGTLSIAILGLIGIYKRENRTYVLGGFFISIVIGATVLVTPVYTGSTGYVGGVSSLITKRFVDRNPIEDWDGVVLNFLRHEPEYVFVGVGLGNVHLFADKYIPPIARYYMEGNIFVAKSGYLKIISELGIIGFILFLIVVSNVFFQVYHAILRAPPGSGGQALGRTVLAVGVVMFVGGMARIYIWPQMFLALGFCQGYRYLIDSHGQDDHLDTMERAGDESKKQEIV